jgi:hypothetical protein
MADELEQFYITPPSVEHGAQRAPVNPAARPKSDELERFYIGSSPPPTLGQGTPRPSPYDVNERRRLRNAYANATREQKFEGAVRTAMNAVPLIGESWQPSNDPNLQMFREGAPGYALGARMVGGGVPYLLAGSSPAVGRMLFGSLPRSVGSGALIEGFDEQSRGGEFATGAARGATLAAIPGVAGKAVTPRRTATVAAERQRTIDAALNVVREQHNNFINSPMEAARVQRIIASTPRDQVDRVVRDIRQQYDQMQRRAERQVIDWISQGHRSGIVGPHRDPLPSLADLPAWMNMTGGGLLGTLLAGGGHGFPVGALAGWGIGAGAKMARRNAQRLANSPRFNRYFNNQVFPDEMQQLIRASGLAAHPVAEDITEGRLGTREILNILRGGGNAP